jgi:SPP1 family predicted phage head-tail adaptor
MLSDVQRWFAQSVLIERPTVSSGFAQTTTWGTVATVMGYVRLQGANESIDYGGDNVRSTHRLVTAVTDITEADRITVDGKVYQVRYVDTKELDGESWMQIDVEYIGAAG